MSDTDVYASDPDSAPDSEFTPGELRHLVRGNRGRLLDARRTPVEITAVIPERGAFELEVGAFEDAGARWELPIEDVQRFQFTLEAPVAPAPVIAQLEGARDRFAAPLEITCDPTVRAATESRLAAEQSAARAWLERRMIETPDIERLVAERSGDLALFTLLEDRMEERGHGRIERAFSDVFVSNPASGELVKGHAIVLAELGLVPFYGKIVRDPELFTGAWSKPRRAEHILTRLAFMSALWSQWNRQVVTLYRGAATDGPVPARSPASFISATFAREVAQAHFEGGPSTRVAVMWRAQVPVARLFMTFLETRAMSGGFDEAEAVLLGNDGDAPF